MKDKLTPIVLILAGVALLAALMAPRAQFVAPREDQPAPDFAFVLNGQETTLSALRGQVVVLNFWASWCPPCVEEMPSLEGLHQQLGGNRLLVLGISVDESREAYSQFLTNHKLTFPNHRDPEKRISTLYGTFMYPETYIIDKKGIIVRKAIGAVEWDSPSIIQYLQALLNEPA